MLELECKWEKIVLKVTNEGVWSINYPVCMCYYWVFGIRISDLLG